MTLVFGPPRPTPAGERDGWWRRDALCAQVGGDEWYPEEKGDHRVEAKRMCLSCPVLFECRQYATDNREVEGVWGALGVGELRAMAKLSDVSRRAQIDHGKPTGNRRAREAREHGTPSRYSVGCRCEACRGAARRYRVELEARRSS